ncbi:hypothetical protein L1887_37202 [Cichorium endivia]|nr:hypothetical protein L1887_37202 [Cichorium endivia]
MGKASLSVFVKLCLRAMVKKPTSHGNRRSNSKKSPKSCVEDNMDEAAYPILETSLLEDEPMFLDSQFQAEPTVDSKLKAVSGDLVPRPRRRSWGVASVVV